MRILLVTDLKSDVKNTIGRTILSIDAMLHVSKETAYLDVICKKGDLPYNQIVNGVNGAKKLVLGERWEYDYRVKGAASLLRLMMFSKAVVVCARNAKALSAERAVNMAKNDILERNPTVILCPVSGPSRILYNGFDAHGTGNTTIGYLISSYFGERRGRGI